MTTSPAVRFRKDRFLLVVGVTAAITAGITYLLVTIFEHKQDAKNPYIRFVNVTENTTDPEPWGINWPREYDTYKKTSNMTQTKYGGHGGSEDPNQADAKGNTALHFAARNGSVKGIAALASYHASLNAVTNDHLTPIEDAAHSGQVEAYKELLLLGAQVEPVDPGHVTILHWGARGGKVAMVKYLLADAGEKKYLEAKTDDGLTPLMEAVALNRLEAATVLLDAGADADASSANGSTALLYAASGGNADAVALLLRFKANPNVQGPGGMTPLMWATTKGNATAVNMLLGAGADMNMTSHEGLTALEMAQRKSDSALIKLFSDARSTDPLRHLQTR